MRLSYRIFILTAGNVIQIGIVIRGIKYKYLLIFLAATDVVLVDVVIILSKVTSPPTTGIIPVGSGEVKSLNHNRPSVSSSGFY